MNPTSTSAAARGVRGSPAAPALSIETSLDLVDPRIAGLIAAETERQRQKLIFIASESLCPQAVRDAVASPLSNLYAEGYPSSRNAVSERELLDWDARSLSFYRRYGDRRYYKGCDYANLVEAEAIKRLAELFATPATPARAIFCNVQSLSGAAANNAVYEALVPIESTVMGMHLSTGGHLTHGSPVNRSGKHFRIVPYVVDPVTGRIDMAKLRADAVKEKPKLLIAGYSAYPWTIDWKEFRAIADEAGAYLLADIAHPAGLVAAGEFPNPIDHAHVVSFTTHKTLCGPRGAVLLTRDADLARKIDLAVFPGEQGGPHLHAIAGKAVAFKLANSDEFRRLMKQVRENAAALAAGFSKGGLTLAYGGTDTHLALVDLRTLVSKTGDAVSADAAARVLDLVGITCNKNSIHGDTRALHPSGLRFGTCWVAQRGMDADDMTEIAAIVTDTLTSMQAFSVHTAAGLVGRVRLPATVMRDAQRRVKKLVERKEGARFGAFSYPHYEPDGPASATRTKVAALANAPDDAAALESGAALVDTTRAPALLVTGERAGDALQLTLSGDLLRLKSGTSTVARALDTEGKLIGEFRVARVGKDARGGDRRGFEQYVVAGDPDAGLDLAQWLRDLSDGVVAFDADLMRKIDGPIVVEDLGTTSDPRRSVLLTVAGPKAGAAMGEAGLLSASDLKAGELRRVPIGDVASGDFLPALVFAHELRGSRVYEIVVPVARADELARKLLAHAKPVSEKSYLAWRAKQGAPKVGAVPPAAKGDAEKPWFIGQQALVGAAGFAATKEPFTAPEGGGALQKTALNEWHKKSTKKWNIVDFAGWEMPVLYGSIVDEHRAVRTAAGLFDVSHMGCYEVKGEGAGRFLDLVTTNYVGKLRDGEGQYSYALAPDGHVLDDLIVYRRAADRFLVIVNASNATKVEAWWRGVLAGRHALDAKRPSVRCDVDVELINLKERSAAGPDMRVDIALQGPAALPTLLELCDDDAGRYALSHLKRFGLVEVKLRGDSVLAARTGYTGEDVGFELYIHPDRLVQHWEAILAAGKARGVMATALGARDSTRTEAGFPLYGHELAGEFDIGPHGAGYPSFVKFHKPFFVGREALLAREAARTNKIFRARVTDPSARPVRVGDTVVDPKGRYLGRVTSAAYAGAEQIVLLWLSLADKNAVAKGAKLGIFPLPRDHKKLPPEPAKDELKSGDAVLLPVPAEIVTRFLGAGEKSKRSYAK
jgi:glycine cleavage system T protein